MAIVRKGDFITVTERRCSAKIQPHIEEGGIYHVNSIDRTPSGVEVLVLDRDLKKGTTVRINAGRFRWKKITQREMTEKAIAEDCMKATQRFVEKFSPEEYVRISYVPLMIAEIAWSYAERAAAQAASERIEMVKPLSRAVRELRTHYMALLRKKLDLRIIRSFQDHANKFIAEYAFDFTVLEASVFNGIGFQHPHIQYQELRKLACISIMLVAFCRDYEAEQAKVIRRKIGDVERRGVPHLEELRALMDAYLGNYTIAMNENMKLAMKKLRANIDSTEFVITDIELINHVWRSVWADKKGA